MIAKRPEPPRLTRTAFTACLLLAGAILLASVPTHAMAGEPVAEPEGYRNSDYRSPVPATLKGAKVVATEEAKALMDRQALFIDVYPRPPKPPNLPAGTVWRDPAHESIEGAHWLPNVGYGVLSPAAADYFKSHLETLTGGDKARPVVFFCLKDCWMSWNAAKRALELGYASVAWFPDGTDGWRDLGLPVASLQPLP